MCKDFLQTWEEDDRVCVGEIPAIQPERVAALDIDPDSSDACTFNELTIEDPTSPELVYR